MEESRVRSVMDLMQEYEKVKHLTGEGIIVPHWQAVNDEIVRDVFEKADENFMRHPTFNVNTFADHPQATRYVHQLNYIFANWDRDRALDILLQEPTFGNPPLKTIDYWVMSPNSVQHLYHLVYWQTETGKNLDDVERVVEWGGGYGSLARIFKRINPGVDYTIIDTPTYSTLQRWYFSRACPDLFFTLVPVGSFDPTRWCDLFVSTWALSESSLEAIGMAAASTTVIDAPSVLLAFQDTNREFEAAGDVVAMLNNHRVEPIENIKEVDYLPKGNYYAVA